MSPKIFICSLADVLIFVHNIACVQTRSKQCHQSKNSPESCICWGWNRRVQRFIRAVLPFGIPEGCNTYHSVINVDCIQVAIISNEMNWLEFFVVLFRIEHSFDEISILSIMPNCEVDCCLQGYLVNWEIERQVWDHIFGKERLNVRYAKAIYPLLL